MGKEEAEFGLGDTNMLLDMKGEIAQCLCKLFLVPDLQMSTMRPGGIIIIMFDLDKVP